MTNTFLPPGNFKAFWFFTFSPQLDFSFFFSVCTLKQTRQNNKKNRLRPNVAVIWLLKGLIADTLDCTASSVAMSRNIRMPQYYSSETNARKKYPTLE